MKKISYTEALAQIVQDDSRYHEHGYLFIREALDFTIQALNKPTEGPSRHVSGAELLEGIRQFALQEYGPMARRVLLSWGINRCEDIGEMVFNLVDKGILGKTENDTRADFGGGYDFDEAFNLPFRPRQQSVTRRRRTNRAAAASRKD
jgi:uncharacterized repeat protein (TIGR04138 family)